VGHPSAGTDNRVIKPVLSAEPSLREGLVLRRTREGCYIVVTALRKEVIGRITVLRRGISRLASGYLAGLRRMNREGKERG
jgi:hypothetical protein